jgi:hypothetical protein
MRALRAASVETKLGGKSGSRERELSVLRDGDDHWIGET